MAALRTIYEEPMTSGTVRRASACSVAILVTVTYALLGAQAPMIFGPLDVHVPSPPHPFTVADVTYLVYELHITNRSSRPAAIDRLDVRDRNATPGAPPLLALEEEALLAAIQPIGPAPARTERATIPPGRAVIVFVWVTTRGRRAPAALTHRFEIRDVTGAPANETTPPFTVLIGAPLKGDLWLAANGPDNGVGHRRAVLALTGEGRIPERFAIDWVRLFADGPTFHGDAWNNASYRAFGAEALAVADGVVVNTVDGVPENVPDPVKRSVPITPATIGGNLVTLGVGGHRYATYAHLQPGSLRVKKGDKVRRGQVLALVGNTGNSTEPHLHFQITDGPAAFDAEGLPYGFTSFGLQATSHDVTAASHLAGNSIALDPGMIAKWRAIPSRVREKEMPLEGVLVSFPER
ncbi:MAG: hypothetical protein DMF90_13265 [Acidobacteria bacterium]|nr:MAG: hypothetical protein DMF90_13265 [Acidobacteriota bacterium]